MAGTDDTSKTQPTRNQDRPDVSAEMPSILEQTIEAERRKMMQVHGLLHCLYEVLLYADGEDAILYAQAAQLGAELIDDSVARLDPSKIRRMLEAATLERNSDPSARRDDKVEEPRAPYLY